MDVQRFVSDIARDNDEIFLLLSSILEDISSENKIALKTVFSISELCGAIKYRCEEILNREGGEADEK